MPNGKTYGISFPFQEPTKGTYLKLTETTRDEIRSNLVHLLLTRRGSRYFLPDFGTRIYEYLFDPSDNMTFNSVESDIRESVEKFMPKLQITKVEIRPYDEDDADGDNTFNRDPSEFGYKVKLRIDYQDGTNSFASPDFVVLNI